MASNNLWWIQNKKLKSENEEKKEVELNKNVETNVTLAANAQTITRHGNAASEYVKAYTGKNYQASGDLKQDRQKSLRGISDGRLSNQDAQRNIKQQAGYSAEVMDVAERNAEEILKDSDRRYARADDVMGHKINETKNDIVLIDSDGNEILGANGQPQGTQMKFVKMGQSAEKTAAALTGTKFRNKYPDGEYCVAKDKYDGVMKALQEQEIKLQKQIEHDRHTGNANIVSKKEQLEYVRKVKKNLQKSKITEKEAIFARQHPELWTAQHVIDTSHQAGMKCAETAAAIAFASSFASNLTGYLKGDIDEKTAVKNIAKDTAKTAAGAYITGFSSTAISSALQNSSSEIIREFITKYPDSPAYVITFAVQSFSVIGKRLNGQISDEECFKQIGTNALVMCGSAVGKAVGASLAGPVGAMVGSFIGSVVVRTTINIVGVEIQKLERANVLLQEHRQRLVEAKERYESLCKELDEYDRIFRETYMAHTEELKKVLGDSIIGMAYALQMKDADLFITNTNNITVALGQKVQFNSVAEFKKMVSNKMPLEL